MMRGSDRGAWTMPLWRRRPNASRPWRRTMKFRLLLRMLGNGREGSKVSGVSTGTTCSSKYWLSHSCCLAFHSWLCMKRTPAFVSSGNMTWLSNSYCRRTRSATPSRSVPNSSCEGILSGPCAGAPISMRCFRPATRISKNSSRLVQLIHRKRSRSSNGTSVSNACASTRLWNSSKLSSRLI